MSIERETKRALRWLTFWRIVTAALGIFEDVFGVLARLAEVGKQFFRELSKASFAIENEHARRYYSLTGLDPARADGDESRYQEIRIVAGDEKRPEDADLFDGEDSD